MAGGGEDSTFVTEVYNQNLPFVLQCSKCNSVIGDNFSWVCSRKESETVSLSDTGGIVETRDSIIVCNISKVIIKVVKEDSVICSEDLETSTQGQDLGSTYCLLKCKSCELTLGRMYKTTPKELDELRNIFTFYATQIKCYLLGEKDSSHITDLTVKTPTTTDLQQEIFKLKAFVVTLCERIQDIENCLRENTVKERGQSEYADNRKQASKYSICKSDNKPKRTFTEMTHSNGTKGRDSGVLKRKKT